MGRVLTNSETLNYSVEATPGVLEASPAWKQLEPNAINSFGVTTSKTERAPISKARQRRKGKITDLDSGAELDADLTMDHFKDFIEGFMFARAIGPDILFPTAVTATDYTVAAISAATAGRLIYGAASAKSLIFARGFKTAGNNGLKVLGAVEAAASTAITIAGLAVEAIDPTQQVEIAIAGIRGAAGDLRINADGDLISTVLNFTLLGLTVGQAIHVGGVDVTNQFFETENSGFVEIEAIAANKITLKNRDQAFVTDNGTVDNAAGAGVLIDILFGQYIRNVDIGDADYIERTYQFELASPNLGAGGATNYEYSIGNYANSMSINIPLTEKATATFGFTGLNTLVPTAIRATNAANAKLPNETDAFSTAVDIARLRLTDLDETGLTTDFKSITLTLNNGAEGEKVLATLGPKYINVANFLVDIESQMLFTNPAIIERIRCNRDLQWDMILRNTDGGIRISVPVLTLDGGDREYPANQSVLINATGQAYKHPVLGISLGVSFFPVLPSEGCP